MSRAEKFIIEHDKEVYKPAETVEKILDSIGKDATWMVVSLYPNGREAHFFRYGYKVSKKDLSKDEMSGFTSWVHAVYNSGLFWKRIKERKEK